MSTYVNIQCNIFRNGYLLFFLRFPCVHSNVGPRYPLWPPGRLRLVLTPSGLAPARGVLQHQRDERAQLGLSHLLYRGWDTIYDQGGQLVSGRIFCWHWRCLLGQRVLQLGHDDGPQVFDDIFERFCTKSPETVLIFAWKQISSTLKLEHPASENCTCPLDYAGGTVVLFPPVNLTIRIRLWRKQF